MAKSTSVFVCGECGYDSSKWLGKCPGCGSWNTLSEMKIQKETAQKRPSVARSQSEKLSQIEPLKSARVSTKIGELDRVLGGGLVDGSTVLLGGDPGIGKSTLLLGVSAALLEEGSVLYVSGEESAAQLKLRARRLGIDGDMLVLCETNLEAIEEQIETHSPRFVVVDSIQTIYSSELAAAPGSVSQVRESAGRLTRIAKQTGMAVFLVGHVTKEGALAGPRVLEHMVDTVLYFEGDRHDALRILRAVKNRFGSTNEIGVFEMRDSGMHEVSDPSGLFISRSSAPGCVVSCAMEGTRPVMVELQALLAPTPFGNPRRMAAGVDTGRLILLLAVLEKKAGLRVADKDVYMNVIGGLKLEERASDLAAAICVASSLSDRPLAPGTAVLGEVGLTGEVRAVSRLDQRVGECVRLGFNTIMLPKCDIKHPGAQLIKVKDIHEAISKIF